MGDTFRGSLLLIESVVEDIAIEGEGLLFLQIITDTQRLTLARLGVVLVRQ